MIKYSKKRMDQHIEPKKNYLLKPGTTLELLDVLMDSFIKNGHEVANDQIIARCGDGSIIKISVREFLKFNCNESLSTSEIGNDDIRLVDKIQIIGSVDRKDNLGYTEFPAEAYNAFGPDCFDIDMDYIELYESGLRDDHTCTPLQNYTVKVVR